MSTVMVGASAEPTTENEQVTQSRKVGLRPRTSLTFPTTGISGCQRELKDVRLPHPASTTETSKDAAQWLQRHCHGGAGDAPTSNSARRTVPKMR